MCARDACKTSNWNCFRCEGEKLVVVLKSRLGYFTRRKRFEKWRTFRLGENEYWKRGTKESHTEIRTTSGGPTRWISWTFVNARPDRSRFISKIVVRIGEIVDKHVGGTTSAGWWTRAIVRRPRAAIKWCGDRWRRPWRTGNWPGTSGRANNMPSSR